MDFTGEQFIPGSGKKRLLDEHLERYKFASRFSDGKIVLDIACGTGYGSHILSSNCKEVYGVDISEESINYANNRFHNYNLKFIRSSATEDIFPENLIGIICSFGTIQHLDGLGRKKCLQNLNKWLKNDGTILLSTPNKKITSPFSSKPLNKYHVKEFNKEDIKKELNVFFDINSFMGQRLIPSFFSFYIVRKFIIFLQLVFSFNFGIYDSFFSPEIKKYSFWREARIFFIILKKKS